MTDEKEIWADDLLGFKEVGESFGNLIRSIDDSKVVSIEAGYGRGKTFFRTEWAKQLRAEGEVVVEVDALLSDLTGDPVLTFIAALVGALPNSETSSGKKLVENSRKFGGLAARSALRLVLRQGAEEIIDFATENAVDALGESDKPLKEAAQEFGDGLSKSAGDLIASQVAAERLRTVELPEQLKALRDALCKEAAKNRVVILVDELDRCHPDYAIAFLEAMKLVFGQDGFVFCLFVNADYLQRVADHRFGKLEDGEQYLDKFVDFRLKLPVKKSDLATVFRSSIQELPEYTPLGDMQAFSRASACKFATDILEVVPLTMRQIKRVLSKLDLIIRMNPDEPIDLHMLILLSLKPSLDDDHYDWSSILPRFKITPEYTAAMLQTDDWGDPTDSAKRQARSLFKEIPEVFKLEKKSYGIPAGDNTDYFEWYKVGHFLAPHYIPSHQDMLDAVHKFDTTP